MINSEGTRKIQGLDRSLTTETGAQPVETGFRAHPIWKRILLWLTPNLTAFVASFCIMVLELVAGRVISRYLGSSLYTWTSVIGVVLGGIAIGNLVGGRLADWFRPTSTLAILFLIAGTVCLLTPSINDQVNDWSGWQAKRKDAGLFMKSLLLCVGPDDDLADVMREVEDHRFRLKSSDTSAEEKAELQMSLMSLEKKAIKFKEDRRLPWSAHIFGHVLLVFLLPATILGTISPVVAKMALDQGSQLGRTVGNVYAWGALGSIVGTFVTGFYLISEFGTKPIIYGVSVVLGAMGIAYSIRRFLPYAAPAAALIFFVIYQGAIPFEWVARGGRTVLREQLQWTTDADGSLLTDVYVDDTDYTYIKIVATIDKDTQAEKHRDLYMDSLIHAEVNLNDPTDLLYVYENIYQAVTHKFAPDGDEGAKMACLFLGGGGYVYPRYVRTKWPKAHIEVAEIDPAVTAADVAGFGLEADDIQIVSPMSDREHKGKPLWIYHIDARNHVDDLLVAKASGEQVPQFDFVYGDAFNFLGPPFHLTTKEFTEKVKGILKPGEGIYMVNIIEIFKSGKFLGAVYNTFRQVFGQNVYVFCNTAQKPSTNRDTYIVIGSLRHLDLSDLPGKEAPFYFVGCLLNTAKVDPDDVKYLKDTMKPADLEKMSYLDVLTDDHHGGSIVLTDDYAPVENLLRYVVDRWK